MRAFIALELSKEIKEELGRLQNGLKPSGADVKWVEPENIHLTLKFLGDTEDSKIEPIKKVLKDISSQIHAFEISIFKLGAFPNLNYPRVVWTGIDKGCSEAERLAASVENGLEKLGFPKETRPFSAHLTLGRVRTGKNKSELKEKILGLEVRPIICAVNHITLFESKLTPSGPIYTERGRFTLKGS